MCKDGTTPFMTDDNNPCLPAPPLSAPLSDPRATATSPHALRSFLLAIVLPPIRAEAVQSAHGPSARSQQPHSCCFGVLFRACHVAFKFGESPPFLVLSTAFPWHFIAFPLHFLGIPLPFH